MRNVADVEPSGTYNDIELDKCFGRLNPGLGNFGDICLCQVNVGQEEGLEVAFSWRQSPTSQGPLGYQFPAKLRVVIEPSPHLGDIHFCTFLVLDAVFPKLVKSQLEIL
jgi:hypothetical protein